MNKETEKILATLDKIVEPLSSANAGISSDGDEPFHAFAWSTAEQGQFSFAALLNSIGTLTQIDISTLIAEWQSKNAYNSHVQGLVSELPNLIEILRSQLKQIQAYQLKTYTEETWSPNTDLEELEVCEFIIGELQGEWIGICPVFPKPHTVSYGQKFKRDTNSLSPSVFALKQQIDRTLIKLKPALVRYEPQLSSCLILETAITKNELIEKLLQSAQVLEIWQFKRFIKNYDNLEEDEKYHFSNLESFVNQNFQQPLLYVLGNWCIFRLYLLGQISNGDWLGSVTVASWT